MGCQHIIEAHVDVVPKADFEFKSMMICWNQKNFCVFEMLPWSGQLLYTKHIKGKRFPNCGGRIRDRYIGCDDMINVVFPVRVKNQLGAIFEKQRSGLGLFHIVPKMRRAITVAEALHFDGYEA